MNAPPPPWKVLLYFFRTKTLAAVEAERMVLPYWDGNVEKDRFVLHVTTEPHGYYSVVGAGQNFGGSLRDEPAWAHLGEVVYAPERPVELGQKIPMSFAWVLAPGATPDRVQAHIESLRSRVAAGMAGIAGQGALQALGVTETPTVRVVDLLDPGLRVVEMPRGIEGLQVTSHLGLAGALRQQGEAWIAEIHPRDGSAPIAVGLDRLDRVALGDAVGQDVWLAGDAPDASGRWPLRPVGVLP